MLNDSCSSLVYSVKLIIDFLSFNILYNLKNNISYCQIISQTNLSTT